MFGKVSFITCATAYPRNTRYRRRVRLEWVRYPDRVPTGLLRAVQCRAGGSEQSLRVIRHWIVRRGDTRRCADLKQVALPEYRGGKTGDLPSDDPFQRRDRSIDMHQYREFAPADPGNQDRQSTRLNSSH